MSGGSSRKPSGSSTHSGAHSPLSSPSNGHSQGGLNPATAASMYGVGMNNTNGIKGLNSGWQVWGSATPSSKKNASVSSAASVNDLQPQGDPNFLGNLGEGWVASRPNSANWEDVNDVAQKKEFSHMNLHHTRQRQPNVAQGSFSGPRIDDRSTASRNGQFSPQRYHVPVGKDTSSTPYPSASPTRHFGATTYSGQQTNPQVSVPGGNYDAIQTSSAVNDELLLALRGMAVEDDHHAQQNRQQMILSQPSLPSRGPPLMPQPRPYGGYLQPDYTYYPLPPARESYIDYNYGYDTYRGPSDPSMYSSPGVTSVSSGNVYPGVSQPGLPPNSLPEMHRNHPGVFFDYGSTARPGSQFFYPAHQGVIYPPPTHSPMITPQVPATLADKKRELQYNIQQQLSSSQGLVYGSIRSTPSPHPFGTVDYGSQIPLMIPGGLYGHSPLHIYPHNMRPNRRSDIGESPTALRSPLLDEFRANKTRKWELRDIFGFVVEFSGDQHGSRFIQQRLENATSEEKQIVFDEIVPNNTLQLIQDVFGNYVIQKLFEHGTQVQKTVLANTMEGHVLTLSFQMYGCRVVQKAIEYILPDQQGIFVRELEPHVLKCVKDSNGNHVIQKLVERVSPDRLGFVNAFRGNVYDLSTHPYGCRVLQRCLEHLPEDITRPLMDELHKYAINLMQDQFGNYVIQYVLEHGKPHDRALVISKLRGQILHMARHKFASNVCEKALVCADPDSRRTLIDEIMTPKHDGVSPILTMMKDQYANYVLQRALVVVDGDQRDALITKIRPQLVSMRRYSSAYTKHLLSIERLIDKYSQQLDQPPPQLTVISADHTR